MARLFLKALLVVCYLKITPPVGDLLIQGL